MPKNEKNKKEEVQELEMPTPIEETEEIVFRNPEMVEGLDSEASPGVEDLPPPPPPAAPEIPELNTEKSLSLKADDPMVACYVLKKHTCCIQQIDYDFKKDESVRLPNSVATILAHAGVLIKK